MPLTLEAGVEPTTQQLIAFNGHCWLGIRKNIHPVKIKSRSWQGGMFGAKCK